MPKFNDREEKGGAGTIYYPRLDKIMSEVIRYSCRAKIAELNFEGYIAPLPFS